MSAESIVCSNYFHYRYTPVNLDIIIFSLTIRKFFDFVALFPNLYAGQEDTVRTGHGTTDGFQIGKGVHQGCILYSACKLNKQSDNIQP